MLAGTGVWKINSAACGFSSIKIDYSEFKVVRDPCQKITLLLLKSKSVRVIVPESCLFVKR